MGGEDEEEHYADGLRQVQPRYALTALQSLTSISQVGNFDNDIVLNEVKDNYREFQTWWVDEEGKMEPWNLPIDREAHEHNVEISMHWAGLEDQKASHEFNLITVGIF